MLRAHQLQTAFSEMEAQGVGFALILAGLPLLPVLVPSLPWASTCRGGSQSLAVKPAGASSRWNGRSEACAGAPDGGSRTGVGRIHLQTCRRPQCCCTPPGERTTGRKVLGSTLCWNFPRAQPAGTEQEMAPGAATSAQGAVLAGASGARPQDPAPASRGQELHRLRFFPAKKLGAAAAIGVSRPPKEQ